MFGSTSCTCHHTAASTSPSGSKRPSQDTWHCVITMHCSMNWKPADEFLAAHLSLKRILVELLIHETPEEIYPLILHKRTRTRTRSSQLANRRISFLGRVAMPQTRERRNTAADDDDDDREVTQRRHHCASPLSLSRCKPARHTLSARESAGSCTSRPAHQWVCCKTCLPCVRRGEC